MQNLNYKIHIKNTDISSIKIASIGFFVRTKLLHHCKTMLSVLYFATECKYCCLVEVHNTVGTNSHMIFRTSNLQLTAAVVKSIVTYRVLKTYVKKV